MPIFRVKSVKIYTGQKNLHWRRRPRRRQLSGMLMFRISGIAPHLGFRGPIGIPTEIVISHVGEIMIMRFCVRPPLTRDPVNSGVCFSNIVTTWCRLLLAVDLPFWFGEFYESTLAKDENRQEQIPLKSPHTALNVLVATYSHFSQRQSLWLNK